MNKPDSQGRSGQRLWSGEFVSRKLEHRYRTRTNDVFCRQIRLLAIIILILSLPFIGADYQALGDFEHAETFSLFRVSVMALPAWLLLATQRRADYRLIDRIVFAYVMYVAIEAFLIMYLFRSEPIVVVSRLIFFVMVANTLIVMPARNRAIVIGTSFVLTMTGLWSFTAVTAQEAISLTVILASTYAVGFVVGSWLALMRRSEFARRVELNSANNQLEFARRNAENANSAKSVFLANMSHELRTPLNAIIGFADLLHQGLLGEFRNAKQKEYIGDIRLSGQHLLSLINDLLDLNRIEAGHIDARPDWFSLQLAATDWLLMVREQAADQNQEIEIGWLAPELEVHADPRMIQQCMTNLLNNAIKYGPDGQTIRVWAERAGEGLRIMVQDQGPGLSREEIDRALKPFEQVDGAHARQSVGWGLGLPLVKSTAEAMGGELLLESLPETGLRATLYLPTLPLRDRAGEPVEASAFA